MSIAVLVVATAGGCGGGRTAEVTGSSATVTTTTTTTTSTTTTTTPPPTTPPPTTPPPTTAPPVAPGWDEIATATIPALCNHPPTKLVGGRDVTLGPDDGVFELRQTLDDGTPGTLQGVPSEAGPLTAVVATCNAGGVGWPNPVLFFAPGGRFYAWSDLGGEDRWAAAGMAAPGRDGVQNLRLVDGAVEVLTTAELPDDPSCCPSSTAVVTLRPGAGEVEITSLFEDVGD